MAQIMSKRSSCRLRNWFKNGGWRYMVAALGVALKTKLPKSEWRPK